VSCTVVAVSSSLLSSYENAVEMAGTICGPRDKQTIRRTDGRASGQRQLTIYSVGGRTWRNHVNKCKVNFDRSESFVVAVTLLVVVGNDMNLCWMHHSCVTVIITARHYDARLLSACRWRPFGCSKCQAIQVVVLFLQETSHQWYEYTAKLTTLHRIAIK